jgi:archaetidylinositol phosphate synthase
MVFWGYFVLNNLRDTLKPALEKMGRGFAATGLSPNFWTSVGLGFALLSAVVYGFCV